MLFVSDNTGATRQVQKSFELPVDEQERIYLLVVRGAHQHVPILTRPGFQLDIIESKYQLLGC